MTPRFVHSGFGRRAFTLIEALTVASVVSLLVALLLPALTAARESARRSQCANNLKQIGIALHFYNDSFGSFPPGRMLSYDPRFTGPRPPCTSAIVDKSFLVMMLPLIEQSPLYNSVNQSLTIFGYENRTIMPVTIATFSCPSDWASKTPGYGDTYWMARYDLATESELLPVAFSSYSGCFGSYAIDAIPRWTRGCTVPGPLAAQANGMIGDAAPISVASVRDGLSNTTMVTERAVSPLLGQPRRGTSAEFGWYISGNWGDTLITAFYPPNAPRKLPKIAGSALVLAASSLHPSGLNALLGDGSVRFVRDSVQSWPFDVINGNPIGASLSPDGTWVNCPPPGIWQALSTRAGQELVDSSDY